MKIEALLERLMFCGPMSGGGHRLCPYCREAFGKYGHAPECDLDVTLRELQAQRTTSTTKGVDTGKPWLYKTRTMKPETNESEIRVTVGETCDGWAVYGPEARMAIQCVDPDTRETGSFHFVGDSHRLPGTRVSPVFSDCALLFAWAKNNGWESLPGTGALTWRQRQRQET